MPELRMGSRLFLLTFLWLVACQVGSPLAAPTPTTAPPTVTPRPSPTPTPPAGSVQGFRDFLAQAKASSAADRQALANRYIAQLEATPLREAETAIFLWRGEAQRVAVVGDMNNWRADETAYLTRLERSDLWYLAQSFEPDARLDYRFFVDEEIWQLDPLNPRTSMALTGPASELAMPSYQLPPELMPAEQAPPAGQLSSHTLNSVHLDQTRTFVVYTPAGQLVGEKLPSIFVQDGGDFLNIVDGPSILDRLIVRRDIPPLIAVFVPPINRREDYTRNDAYAAFLADELVPFVQATYDSDPEPARTGLLGASTGGLAALHASLAQPDVFGLAASLSGTFGPPGPGNGLSLMLESDGEPATRVYLEVGSYETALELEQAQGNILAENRGLAQALRANGYQVRYVERPEGHSWGLWQVALGAALRYLYG